MKLKKIAALLAAAGVTVPAFATNGMNMEGYGPVATAMGGASYAYDNGTAGLINNPATLSLMASGTSRLDLAVGGLHPSGTAKMAGMPDAKSNGTAYYMPAVGYVRKDDKLTWGIGMMAQGGMGTEYGTNTFLSGYKSMTGANGGLSGQENRAELGLGRVMLPLSYDVSDTLKVGGTVDYLWGGLDLRMVMDGGTFAKFITPGATPLGSASGSMVNALPNFMVGGLGGRCAAPAPACITDVNYAQFDFSEGGNKMKQQATTSGWAGNLGFVWKASPALSVGGVYHGKTSLKDMEGDANIKMNVMMNAPGSAPGTGGPNMVTIAGRIKVINFQWPETYGLGIAYQASDRLMLVADYKKIGWSKVMQNFRMSFTASASQTDPMAAQMVGAGAGQLNATLNQNWSDQNVVMLGGSYKTSDALTLRAGVNLANNPIPDNLMNPLFPATIKNHLAAGAGYAFDKASSVDFSLVYAPKVTVTNAIMGVTIEHSQTNWQLMYSRKF
jgi:long-chain fatty acid transport protein